MPQVSDSTDLTAPLLDFIARELISGSDPDLDAEDDLLSSGRVDSLGVMRLIRHVEETFGLTVPPEDVTLENFITVRAIASFLETLRGSGSDG